MKHEQDALHTLHCKGVCLLGDVGIYTADMPEEMALKVEQVSQKQLQEMTQSLCKDTAVSTWCSCPALDPAHTDRRPLGHSESSL